MISFIIKVWWQKRISNKRKLVTHSVKRSYRGRIVTEASILTDAVPFNNINFTSSERKWSDICQVVILGITFFLIMLIEWTTLFFRLFMSIGTYPRNCFKFVYVNCKWNISLYKLDVKPITYISSIPWYLSIKYSKEKPLQAVGKVRLFCWQTCQVQCFFTFVPLVYLY